MLQTIGILGGAGMLMGTFDPTLLSSYIDLRLIIATILGAIIGLERELAGKDPSFRTFALISLGSCMFAIISNSLNITYLAAAVKASPEAHFVSDPGRIAAQVVVGIGFLGAGTIYRAKQRVLGLTTAALMWVTAAIGMAIGFEKFELGIGGTVTVLLALFFLGFLHRIVYYLRNRSGSPEQE